MFPDAPDSSDSQTGPGRVRLRRLTNVLALSCMQNERASLLFMIDLQFIVLNCSDYKTIRFENHGKKVAKRWSFRYNGKNQCMKESDNKEFITS